MIQNPNPLCVIIEHRIFQLTRYSENDSTLGQLTSENAKICQTWPLFLAICFISWYFSHSARTALVKYITGISAKSNISLMEKSVKPSFIDLYLITDLLLDQNGHYSSRRHFQMHFLDYKWWNSDSNSHWSLLPRVQLTIKQHWLR